MAALFVALRDRPLWRRAHEVRGFRNWSPDSRYGGVLWI